MKKLLSDTKGQFIIFVTLAFVLLGLFVGLAVDAGRAYLLRGRLSRLVDSVSMAGARYIVQGFAEAKARACDKARVNGYACVENGGPVDIQETTVPYPDGTSQIGIQVSATASMNTSFMALGSLIGCGTTCQNVTVATSAIAAPGLVDLVLVVDDTGTMKGGPVAQGRLGAGAVVDKLIGGSSDVVQIALVPFRACYSDQRLNLPNPPARNQRAGAGCVLFDEIIPLTSDPATIQNGIDDWKAEGGYPGTNVCLGMHQGREVLFGDGSRAIARKVMVILSDGDNSYTDGARTSDGGNSLPPNEDVAPPVYPEPPYTDPPNSVKQWPFNTGGGPLDACRVAGFEMGVDPLDGRVGALDVKTQVKATDIKLGQNVGTSGQTDGVEVEIFVLRFAKPDNDDSAKTMCNVTMVGQGSGRGNSNDEWDRNLSRCIATHVPDTTDAAGHFFYAASPGEIRQRFEQIADEILRTLRLVI